MAALVGAVDTALSARADPLAPVSYAPQLFQPSPPGSGPQLDTEPISKGLVASALQNPTSNKVTVLADEWSMDRL